MGGPKIEVKSITMILYSSRGTEFPFLIQNSLTMRLLKFAVLGANTLQKLRMAFLECMGLTF